MQGGSKLKTQSQGQKSWIQSRNMPTKAVRSLKKGMETKQRRAGGKEIKSQMRGEAIAECLGLLRVAFLGEDWKKNAMSRAAKAPEGSKAYLAQKKAKHADLASMYNAQYFKRLKLNGKPTVASAVSHRNMKRHAALGNAYASLKSPDVGEGY